MRHRLSSWRVLFLFMLVPAVLFSQGTKMSAKPAIDIPYQKFVLDNGLTVIIHEDHKAPIVAVNVWYHVGSKNERVGKSGFAHLFEHLMFNGSENFNTDYFQAMERVGATDMNGTTNEDRTNYFQNVPISAFELALWMESDRMGHLLGAVDQAKLDEQRGVVQNEKRQGDNQPYAISEELITKAVWPSGHPYDHTVIGSMEDLNAASLSDVQEWFRTYYGPANSVLTIAGDVEPQAALALVKKYFGDIPSGPPVARFDSWTSKRSGTIRQQAQDRVPQARLYQVWNIPGWGKTEASHLDLISDLLSVGKSSRLYKRLVYDDQIATNVAAYIDLREIAGLFVIEVTAKPGQGLAKIEQTVDEELAKFLKNGPSNEELERAKTAYEANFIRGIERIGGFGGKSDILAQNEVFAGSPDFYKTTLARVKASTVKDLQQTAVNWLGDGAYILEINPFPEYTAFPTDSTLRKNMPAVGESPLAKFPTMQKATLSNGLNIILVNRPSVPMVNFTMLFDAGYASDQLAIPGTANLAMNMMDEGTKTRTALQISDELLRLGANLSTGSNLDMSRVYMSALKSKLEPSLALFADVILNPSFPQEDLERLKKQTIAAIQREKSQPITMGYRVLPALLYGKEHSYGTPFTGSGYESTVAKLTRDDMVKFHQTWIKPNNATLIITGDAELGQIKSMLEQVLANWKAGDVPKKNITDVAQNKSQVYIMDKPGSPQSVIFASFVTVPQNNPDEIAIQALNTLLGGSFTSRINMNLREGKHWSYGARSIVVGATAQRPFFVYAPIQSDKTKESMIEISKELNDILTSSPATEEEVTKTKNNLSLRLPGMWETNNSVSNSIENLVRFKLAEDYYDKYAKVVKDLTLPEVNAAAKKLLHPANIVWVVVGDRAKIEDGIRGLNYGEVKYLDGDGNIIP
jgi:zinc protease